MAGQYHPPEGSRYIGEAYGLQPLQAMALPTFETQKSVMTSDVQDVYFQIQNKEYGTPSEWLRDLAWASGHFPRWLHPNSLGAYKGVYRRERWVDANFQHRANGFAMPR